MENETDASRIGSLAQLLKHDKLLLEAPGVGANLGYVAVEHVLQVLVTTGAH